MRRSFLGLAALVLVLAGCSSGAPKAGVSAASFSGSGFAACPATTGSATGKLAKVAALPCMDGSGKKMSIGAPTGKPMVVNLWGSWCPPCGKEMPSFVQFAAAAADQVTVLGVDTADSGTNAVAAAQDYKVQYANLYDRNESVRKALGVNALPATAFVTADGQLAYLYRGAPLTETVLAGLVAKHLGVTLR